MSCFTALVLLLDISGSINDGAWALQRDGHAAAFQDPGVVRAITRAGLAVAVVQWDSAPRVAMGWRVLRTETETARMASDMAGMTRLGRGSTQTGLAIMAGLSLLDDAPCGERQVLDLVTDGPSDTPIADARNAAIEAGVRINGLGVQVGFGDPAEWLRENAITPDGFVVSADGWGEFARAIRLKLSTEIGALR